MCPIVMPWSLGVVNWAKAGVSVKSKNTNSVSVWMRMGLPLLRQGKDVKRVCSAWRRDIDFDRAHCSRYETRCREIVPRDDSNVLPAVDRVGNRARGNRPAENRFPHDLSAVGIEGAEAAIEIPEENDVSS